MQIQPIIHNLINKRKIVKKIKICSKLVITILPCLFPWGATLGVLIACCLLQGDLQRLELGGLRAVVADFSTARGSTRLSDAPELADLLGTRIAKNIIDQHFRPISDQSHFVGVCWIYDFLYIGLDPERSWLYKPFCEFGMPCSDIEISMVSPPLLMSNF